MSSSTPSTAMMVAVTAYQNTSLSACRADLSSESISQSDLPSLSCSSIPFASSSLLESCSRLSHQLRGQ